MSENAEATAKDKAKEAEKIRSTLKSGGKTQDGVRFTTKSSSETILFGFFISVSIALAIFVVAEIFFPSLNIFVAIGLVFLSIGLIYIPGFNEIEIGSMAILLKFGERTRIIFKEGYVWTLPKPIQDIEIVDLREHTTEIRDKEFISMYSEADKKKSEKKETGNENQEESAEDETTETEGQESPEEKKKSEEQEESEKVLTERAMMRVSAAIQWMVKDPWKFKDTGPSVVEEGLRYVIISSTREMAVQHTPLVFLKLKAELGDRIDEAADAQADRWGIEVLNVNVTRIEFANKDIEKAAEDRMKERMQKDAETYEMRHAVNMINMVAKEALMSPADAATFVHRERNKFKSAIDHHFSGNPASDLMVHGAMQTESGSDDSDSKTGNAAPVAREDRKRGRNK